MIQNNHHSCCSDIWRDCSKLAENGLWAKIIKKNKKKNNNKKEFKFNWFNLALSKNLYNLLGIFEYTEASQAHKLQFLKMTPAVRVLMACVAGELFK